MDGARAYDLAREGETVELEPRAVRIEHLVLLEVPTPDTAVLEARCGKGTYVRALARDDSLGAHYRADFPRPGPPASSASIVVRDHEGMLRLTRDPVRFSRLRPPL